MISKCSCLFLSVALACSLACHALEKLSGKDAAVLDTFFRTLTKQSEAGYVLHGKKPVCSHGFLKKDVLAPETDLHVSSVALKEGAQVWEKLKLPQENIIVHIYDWNSHDIVDEYVHMLVINKKLFLETVQKNLSLFQYVLGPKVTPENLLKAITSPHNTFATVLKTDKVLIGILLGFGAENSIYHSRLENIEEACVHSPDIPPFQCRLNLISELKDMYSDILLFTQSGRWCHAVSDNTLIPSFGFNTIQEEFCTLGNEIESFSETLNNSDPPFCFGRVKNRAETQQFIKELELTQLKIRELTKSPTFLSEVLREITGAEWAVDFSQETRLAIDEAASDQVNAICARNIWVNILDQGTDYINFFLDGFLHYQNMGPFDHIAYYPEEYKQSLMQARKNLKDADRFFNTLSINQTINCVSPFKLYYKKLNQGSGKSLEDQTLITVDYQIFDPHDQCLTKSQVNARIDLAETIPAFAHGVKGMSLGEKREIYIHPALAYGVHTLLEKGIYLRALVTLKEIHDNKKQALPELISMDLSFIHDPNFEVFHAKQFQALAQFEGARMGEYFAKEKSINIEKVYDYLKQLQKKTTPFTQLNDQEEHILNRLHWNLYFTKQ